MVRINLQTHVLSDGYRVLTITRRVKIESHTIMPLGNIVKVKYNCFQIKQAAEDLPFKTLILNYLIYMHCDFENVIRVWKNQSPIKE